MVDYQEIAEAVNQTRLYRPLDDIAAFVPSVDGVEFGIEYLDKITGGLRPKKLNIVTGYSHHGKTSLMLTAIVNNLQKGEPCLFISGDDTDDMLLGKIIAMMEHISTEDVEAKGPEWRRKYVRDNLDGLLIIAASKEDYSIPEVEMIYEDATEEFGQYPLIVCFDYVSLLKMGFDNQDNQMTNIRSKFRFLKKAIRKYDQSVWMVGHQCVKAAQDVPALTLNHMEYGGHQDADGVVIGCRRANMATMDDMELRLEQHMPRSWVSVMKNKVTGRKSNNPIGHSLLIDPVSGILREILDSDKPGNTQKQQIVYKSLIPASMNGHSNNAIQ